MAKTSFEVAIKWLRNGLYHLTHEEVNGKVQRRPLKWGNIIAISAAHGVFIYGVFFSWRHSNAWFRTVTFHMLYGVLGGIGVTGGVHRLWSHRSYKAKLPLRILLAIFFSVAGQNTIPQWVLDHRVHHKFTETDADPHNAARGFFFSHVGWLMQQKSQEVRTKGKQVDMADVLQDPVVKYHTMFFIPLKILLTFYLPTLIPVYFWNESWGGSMLLCMARYIITLNGTWAVNSAAHLYGNKPYDTRIGPAENKWVSYIAVGEGWHNYHHVFPWDYKASEFGVQPNATTTFINLFAAIGWAYDLKYPSKNLVDRVAEKYGDGSRHNFEVLPTEKENGEPEVIVIGEDLKIE